MDVEKARERVHRALQGASVAEEMLAIASEDADGRWALELERLSRAAADLAAELLECHRALGDIP